MLEIVEGKAIGGSGWAPVLAASFGAWLPTRGPGQRGLARRYKSYAGGSAEAASARLGLRHLRAQDVGGMVPIDPS